MSRDALAQLVLEICAVVIMVLTGTIFVLSIVVIWAPDPLFWLRITGTLLILIFATYLLGRFLE